MVNARSAFVAFNYSPILKSEYEYLLYALSIGIREGNKKTPTVSSRGFLVG